MNTRRFLTLATVLTVTATGCNANGSRGGPSSTDGTNTTTEPGSTPNTSNPDGSSPAGSGGAKGTAIGLVRFDGCDALLDYVKSNALERVGPYGLDGGGRDYYAMTEDGMEVAEATTAAAADDMMADSSAAPASAGSESASNDGLTSETGTNVQEAGVDEPDIVKTDGKRIVTLSESESGRTLTVTDITERTPKITGTLKLDGYTYGADMVLAGDRVLVFSRGGGEYFAPIETGDAEASFVPNDQLPAWTSQTVITEISIAAEPEVVGSMAIEGDYLSSRSVGNRVRVAVSSPPVSLPWVFPQTQAGEDRAEESNRQIIQESTLDDWLPNVSIGGGDPSQLLDCGSIQHPAEFAGFDTISILDFDLDAGLAAPTDAVGVMAAGQTIYSSVDRFYVASTDWNWGIIEPVDSDQTTVEPEFQDATTDLHAFAISDSEPTTYVGSGEVPGTLLNQFSMDSFDGNLRVITTSTTPDGDTETFLRVLAENGNQLTEVGSVGGLGKGEQLYSARLFDEIGFAVTYEQIDPLYVLDLSDPTDPRVTGELKIPGVSTYLHPLGDGRLLGVGADATDEGVRTGLKVSLFDVSDTSNPQEIAKWTLEGAGSESEYDSHAFQYSDGLLVLPLSQQDWVGDEPPASEAVVLRIDDTITEVGRIQIDEPDVEPTSDCRAIGVEDLQKLTIWEDGAELDEDFGFDRIQVCPADASGGWGNSYCEPLPYEEMAEQYPDPEAFEADAAILGLEEGGRLEACFPNGDWNEQVRRVISVGDTFYLLTNRQLQANDRTTLDNLGSVLIG